MASFVAPKPGSPVELGASMAAKALAQPSNGAALSQYATWVEEHQDGGGDGDDNGGSAAAAAHVRGAVGRSNCPNPEEFKAIEGRPCLAYSSWPGIPGPALPGFSFFCGRWSPFSQRGWAVVRRFQTIAIVMARLLFFRLSRVNSLVLSSLYISSSECGRS